jgi:hypothetical protein
MFQVAKDMPVTMNELRDSCRSNMTSVIMKYQDQLVKVIAAAIEKSKDKVN